MLLGMIAAVVVEVGVVQGHYFAEDPGLDLLHEVLEEVPVDEAGLGGVVGVQVEVERQPVGKLGDYVVGGQDGRLVGGGRG